MEGEGETSRKRERARERDRKREKEREGNRAGKDGGKQVEDRERERKREIMRKKGSEGEGSMGRGCSVLGYTTLHTHTLYKQTHGTRQRLNTICPVGWQETLFCGNTESAVGRTRDALGTMRRTEPPCPLETPRRAPKQNTSRNHVRTANNSAAYP